MVSQHVLARERLRLERRRESKGGREERVREGKESERARKEGEGNGGGVRKSGGRKSGGEEELSEGGSKGGRGGESRSERLGFERVLVLHRLKAHISEPNNHPILIFPEGESVSYGLVGR
jgi:hypothetical protein